MKVENINTSKFVYMKSRQILGYDVDLDEIGRTTRDVVFLVLKKAVCNVGLQQENTKYPLSSRKEASHRRLGQSITIGRYQFEAVRKLAMITMLAQSRIIRSKQNCFESQNKFIIPVLIYGAECWNFRL